ncbi:MAG: hypothetical protein DMD81_22745 [Candidatus Rokuibacteriota bacterium]|nr:MAG: hypothetical protein DMD81_22745 [Candidatus Rokubacteria bacterium]
MEEFPIGSFVPSVFQDNGNTGDRVGFFTGASDEFTPCLDFVAALDFILAADADVFTLTYGNITITPRREADTGRSWSILRLQLRPVSVGSWGDREQYTMPRGVQT